MPIFKCVYNFISPGTGGGRWSEIYYRAKASLADAASFTPTNLDIRCSMLSTLNTLTKIRVSQVDNPRVTTLVTVNKKGASSDAGIPRVENTGESHVITLASSARPATRKIWMRGCRAGVMYRNDSTGDWEITPLFDTAIKAWIHSLALDGFACVILARKKTVADGVVPVQITNVNGTAGTGMSIVTVDANPLLIATDSLSISGVNDRALPGLNGSYQIVAIAGMNITIKYRVPGDIAVVPTSGTLKKLAYFEDARIDENISGWSYGGVRQTKNDFTGSRGAYRKSRSRR